MTNDETYERILEEAKNDFEVLGFALTGGRGKGFVTEHSDIIKAETEKGSGSFLQTF